MQKLKRIFDKHLNITEDIPEVNSENKNVDNYEKMFPLIDQYSSIFQNGTNRSKFEVSDDGVIDYFGNVLFRDVYIDGEGKLPFKFGTVTGRFEINKLACKKLKSLEGLPKIIQSNLIIDCDEEKPKEFFEGHFPTKVNRIEIVTPKLHNLNFGTSNCESYELVVKELGSFEGMASNCTHLTLSGASPRNVKTFAGVSKMIKNFNWLTSNIQNGSVDQLDFLDLFDHVEMMEEFFTNFRELASDVPVLKIFNLKFKPKLVSMWQTSGGQSSKNSLVDVFTILNKYLQHGDVFDCQEELIDSGFEQYARLK